MSAPAGTAGRSRHHEDRDARPHLPNSPTPPRQPCGGDARTHAAAAEPVSSLVLRRPRWCHPPPERAGAHRMLHHVSSRARPRFPRLSRRGRLLVGGRARPPGRAAGSRPTRRGGAAGEAACRDHLALPSVVVELVGCTARDCAATFAPQVRTGGSGPNGAHDAGSRRRPRIPRSRAPGPGAHNDLGITPRLCRSPVDNPIRGPPELQPSGTGGPPRRSRAPSSAGCPRRFPNYSRDAREVVANGSPGAVAARQARRRATTAPVRRPAQGPPEGRAVWRRSLRSPAPSG